MASKTYIPGMILIMKKLCHFMQTHESVIKVYLSPGNQTLFDAALAACKALDVALDLIYHDTGGTIPNT